MTNQAIGVGHLLSLAGLKGKGIGWKCNAAICFGNLSGENSSPYTH
jgi:hypothetical protein